MKVFACTASNTIAGETHPMCWEDIQRSEGIYEPKGFLHVRLVVLFDLGGRNSRNCTFVYDYGERAIWAPGDWSKERFRRTEEKICVELRPK